MKPVDELHMAYFEDSERPWKRGDIVRLVNGSKFVILETHPNLVVSPKNIKTLTRFFIEEVKILFMSVFLGFNPTKDPKRNDVLVYTRIFPFTLIQSSGVLLKDSNLRKAWEDFNAPVAQ